MSMHEPVNVRNQPQIYSTPARMQAENRSGARLNHLVRLNENRPGNREAEGLPVLRLITRSIFGGCSSAVPQFASPLLGLRTRSRGGFDDFRLASTSCAAESLPP